MGHLPYPALLYFQCGHEHRNVWIQAMPARPIWRGHLRLALVSCPVALWNAKHERSAIRFNQINPKTGNRIRMKTVDAETDEEVQRRDLVKGYEFRKDQYLLLTDE